MDTFKEGGGGRGGRRDGATGGGRRNAQGRPKQAEPELPEHLSADLADRSVHRELRTLSKENAEGVARHLLAISEALEAEDFERALAHAQTAVRRAGRVPIVREMMGVVHYRRGEWAKALSEFRTARRMSGSHHLLPLMADAERGLGRPERALELARSGEAATLKTAERIELALVAAGARGDLGQRAAAVHALADVVATVGDDQPWAARVYYAYADAVIAGGNAEEGHRWLQRAASVDAQGETDAAERMRGGEAHSGESDIVGGVWDLEEDQS